MKKIFVIISNATAGIATYESNLIKLLNYSKQKVCLIANKNILLKKNKKLLEKYYCNALWEPFRVFNYLSIIKKQNNYTEINFVISNSSIFIIYFIILKIFFKNKKIFLIKHSHITNPSINQIIVGFTSSILSNFANRVIFVSNFTLNWWCKYFILYRFANKLVIHNFIYLPKKVIKKKINTFRIAFVGRLDKEKGLNKFIEIAKYIGGNKYKFSVYGNKKSQSQYYKNIKFYGWKEKKQIYNNIDLLIVTSPIENCPFNVLEAKSYGVPTLTTSRGGIKEIIKNNEDGILVDTNAKLDLIKNKIICIKKKHKFFSRNSYQNAKKFDAFFLKKKILKLF